MSDAVVVGTSRGKGLGLAAACVAFTAGGAWMAVAADSVANVAVGVLCVLFFGVGGAVAVVRMMRRSTVLVLDADGLRPQDGGFLPWSNVDELGTTRFASSTCVAVRVRSYTGYALTFTPAERELVRTRTGVARGLALATAGASATQGVDLARDLVLDRDARADLAALVTVPSGREIGALLAWNRRRTGWDLLWPQTVLDRPADEVVRIADGLRAG